MTLGQIVKNYRDAHGMSMEEFGKKCLISKAYVGMIESGINPHTKKPLEVGNSVIKKIAAGMGVSYEYLIRWPDFNCYVSTSIMRYYSINTEFKLVSKHII